MAFTKVVGAGIHTLSNIASHNINSSGIITATKFVGPITGAGGDFNAGIVTATSLDVNGNGDISGNLVIGGNLTANGDFTTLNTTLREVELLRVDATNNTVAAGIITQRGSGDILNLFDGNTEVLTVTDGGKVGIGTVTPSQKLSVYGNIYQRGNDYITWNNGDSQIGGVSGYNFAISTYDGSSEMLERMRITGGSNGGRVGIGTNNPSHKLDISDDGVAFPSASGSTLLRLRDSAGTATLSIDAAAGSFSAIQFGDTAASSMGSILYNHVDDSMKFNTGGTGTKLFIASDGKVGINKDDPGALLHIHNSGTSVLPLKVYRNDVGDVPIAHFQAYNNTIGEVDKFVVTARGRVGVNTDNPQRELHIKPDNSGTSAIPAYARIESHGSNQPAVLELYHTRSNGSDKWPSSVASVDGGLTLNTANGNNGAPQEKARINGTGLGIHTSNPLSGLHISDGTAYGAPQNSSRKATLTISAGSEGSSDIQLLSANYNHIFFGDSTDPNTGIIWYEHTGGGTDSMHFSTAGIERLKIDDDGVITSTQTTPVITIKGTNANANSLASILFNLRDGNSNDYDIAKVFAQTDASNGGYGKILVQTAFNNALYTRIQIDKDGAVQIGKKGAATDLPAATSPLNVRTMTDGNLHVRPSTDLQGGTTGVALDVLNNASNALKDLILRGQTVIFRNSAESLRISSDGQIGLNKASPKAWHSDYKSLQIYDAGYIAGSNDDSFVAIGANNYLATDGSYKYTNTDHTSQLYQVDGTLVFRNAGAAGNDSVVSWTERFNIASTGAASFTGNATGAITHQFYNSNSGSGADTRVLIKTYANQGADPFIKFDSGGSNMIVGQLYAGTTNNKLVLGTGESPSGGVNGIHINGSGQVQIPTNGQQLTWGASQQMKFYYENSEDRMYLQGDGEYGFAFRVNSGNALEIHKTTRDVTMQGGSGRNFLWDNSEPSLYLTDNGTNSARLKIGTGGDLQLYHDVSGSVNHIAAANNGTIKISGDTEFFDYTGVTKRAVVGSQGLRVGAVAAPTLPTTGKQPMIMRNVTYFTKEIHRTISDYRQVCDGTHYGYLLLIPAHPGSGNVSAKKFYGTIICDRGGTGSGNSTQVATVHAATAYNDDQFYVENARNSQYVVSPAKVTYDGTIYLALKFGQSGGGPHNGIHIDGQYHNVDSNFLRLVRQNELDSVQNDTHGAIANHNAIYPICGVMVVDMDGADMNDNSIRYMRGGTIHFEYSPAGTDCYDNGIFTAQVNGIYHVTAGFLTGNNVGRVEAAIQRKVTGGSWGSIVNLNGAGDFANSHNGPTGTAFIKMKTGWQLRLYRVSSNQGVYGSPHANNYFGAVLMHGLMETQV